MGGSGSGRQKEDKSTVNPYKPSSLSGKYFSNLITNKPSMNIDPKKKTIEESLQSAKQNITETIENWALIRKAETSGMPKEIIDEMKHQLGLVKEEEKNDDQLMTQKDIMLMQMIRDEEDPAMKQIYLMSLFNKGKNGIDPAMMAMVMGNGNKKNQNTDFMEKLALKFLDQKTDNKSDIDKGMEFYEKIMKMQEQIQPRDLLDQLKDEKDRLVSLGLVQDATGNIEHRKMDLEFKKLELEHQRVSAEQEAKSQSSQDVMKAVGEGVAALLGAVGHHTKKDTSNAQATQDQIKNSGGARVMAQCSNPSCGASFPLVTTPDRSVNCPGKNCGFSYVIKNGEFYISDESAKLLDSETSSSNEPEEK